MNSRTDGVLRSVPTLLADGRIEAVFTRYASTDPLCCPSRGASRVTYRVQSAGPIVMAELVEALAPQQLPSTGDSLGTVPGFAAMAGALLLGLGLSLRRRTLRP